MRLAIDLRCLGLCGIVVCGLFHLAAKFPQPRDSLRFGVARRQTAGQAFEVRTDIGHLLGIAPRPAFDRGAGV